MASVTPSLASRGQAFIKPTLPYFAKHFEAMADLYDRESNPAGFLSFAVAENRLSFAQLREKLIELKREPTISLSTGCYDDMCGRHEFRKAAAELFSETILHGKQQLAWQNLVVSSGCGAAIFHLSNILMDAGDAALLPTPTYAALYNDLTILSGAHVVDVPLHLHVAAGSAASSAAASPSSSSGLTVECLEKALRDCKERGLPPRMLVLLHPNNPLGTVYSREELRLALQFGQQHRLHILSDEIYAHSVYDEDKAGGPFCSILEIMQELQEEEKRKKDTAGGSASTHSSSGHSLLPLSEYFQDYVHVLWGMSKDFAASGFRVGFLYSSNKQLQSALGNCNYFTAVSNELQDSLAVLFREEKQWTKGYLQSCRAALGKHSAALQGRLTDMGLASSVTACAGMFLWLDLRKQMLQWRESRAKRKAGGGVEESTSSSSLSASASELSWADEEAFVEALFREQKLLLTPGEACHAPEPGWLRFCFAWMSLESALEGLRRLQSFLEGK